MKMENRTIRGLLMLSKPLFWSPWFLVRRTFAAITGWIQQHDAWW
jgi:hypothetical protein